LQSLYSSALREMSQVPSVRNDSYLSDISKIFNEYMRKFNRSYLDKLDHTYDRILLTAYQTFEKVAGLLEDEDIQPQELRSEILKILSDANDNN